MTDPVLRFLTNFASDNTKMLFSTNQIFSICKNICAHIFFILEKWIFLLDCLQFVLPYTAIQKYFLWTENWAENVFLSMKLAPPFFFQKLFRKTGKTCHLYAFVNQFFQILNDSSYFIDTKCWKNCTWDKQATCIFMFFTMC